MGLEYKDCISVERERIFGDDGGVTELGLGYVTGRLEAAVRTINQTIEGRREAWRITPDILRLEVIV